MLKSEGTAKIIKNMARSGEVPQAILITGDKKTGKKETAQDLCRMLFCTEISPDGEPCGKCPACLKISEGNFPDLIHVTHESPDVIRVDEIRDQLADTVQVRPYYGKRKVYIMDDADLMNVQAQNALLKTLEEPPAYCTVILLAKDPGMLLPTVLSRVVRIDLMAGPDLKLSEEQTESELYKAAVSLYRDLSRIAGYETVTRSKEIAGKTEDLQEFIDLTELWYRDALRYQVTGSMEGAAFSGEKKALTDFSRNVTAEGVSEIMACAEKCRGMLKANVNKDAVLWLLLMKMRETK